MILYKYYGADAGLAALQSGKLGFRCPNYFNDPFGCSFPIENTDRRAASLKNTLATMREQVVILSLTKTPLDPLMWTHYGDEHRGFVIGYDVSCPFLDSAKYNLITVSDGSVMYREVSGSEITSKHDDPALHAVLDASLGAPADPSTLEVIRPLAKTVFLTKHPRWSSEKEVRVVKILLSILETVEEYTLDPLRSFSQPYCLVAPAMGLPSVPKGLYLYGHQVPIKEVYLGARNSLRKRPDDDSVIPNRDLAESAAANGWAIRGINISSSSWDLEVVELPWESLLVAPQQKALTYRSSFDAPIASFLRDALASQTISNGDQFEVTTWSGTPYLKKNGDFV